ncbi:hypothetical protein M422DRAFT_205209 [Sphaerobolus stellatus SS14]|nr:hypothetical protein M422DRAFT_205209 [Sphaerobolus stellatus SS14]
MLLTCIFSLCLCLASISYAFPSPLAKGQNASANQTTPLVIWHGLGDEYSSSGIAQFMDMIRDIHQGIFIHSINLAESADDDRKAGWFGDLTVQLPQVAEQLANIPELQGGFDAMGFSQGGQFLRAYVEQYNSPAVRNLITFGSQHMGIAETPACSGSLDVFCNLAKWWTGTRGIYSDWVQTNIIPAQYYRDPRQLPLYLEANKFLVYINNEIADARNETYAKNFASLENLVLVIFTEDKTVVPKESAWFGSYAEEDDASSAPSEPRTIIPMRLQPLYTEDWIGLKQLDEAGKVKLESCEAKHMQLLKECWEPLVKQFVGGNTSVASVPFSHSFLVQQP